MNKLLPLVAVGLLTTAATVQSAPKLTPYMEGALVSVCRSTLSNSPAMYKKALKAYRLQAKTVAQKLVCNGEDVGSFAATHGADRVSGVIRKHQSHVDIIDLAATPTNQTIMVAMR